MSNEFSQEEEERVAHDKLGGFLYIDTLRKQSDFDTWLYQSFFHTFFQDKYKV